MQTIGDRTDRSVEIIVSRQRHQAMPGGSTATDSGPGAEYLESNLMINTDDPELIALAEKAGGGEKEPFALGDKLRRFVTDYVTSKSLNIGFGTASEVCRSRQGDCSEHGVLLAALGRLNGLPSRVVVGVVYLRTFGGRENVLGYHMWTQFFIDGRWIDFDAALRESVCSPTRIAFATSSLKNTGLADLSLPLLSKIGAIDIEILEIEAGKPVD
jgi:transglutaminase-like putative cysteine protease